MESSVVPLVNAYHRTIDVMEIMTVATVRMKKTVRISTVLTPDSTVHRATVYLSTKDATDVTTVQTNLTKKTALNQKVWITSILGLVGNQRQ